MKAINFKTSPKKKVLSDNILSARFKNKKNRVVVGQEPKIGKYNWERDASSSIGAVPAGEFGGSMEIRKHSGGTNIEDGEEKELKNNRKKREEATGMITCMDLDKGESRENSTVNPQA
ncbi:hypothetical protein ACH5RR_013424 [Cinchona calisaya]|uniref:Uncharacterized protein n=1 Tax=Cinchona calisaya TaxID=153742 RepID=A0ABD3A2N5_9GENT